MTLRPGTGSFRDPGGRVFVDGARVLRSVYKGSADDYEAARDSGLLQELIDWNWLAASPRLGFRRRRSKRCCSALRSFVERCELRAKQTVWQGYDADNSYRGEEAERKRQLVQSMATSARPGLMYDLGCNSGDYSAAAIEAGARYVVGFDFDFGALERAVERSHGGNLPFLPLWLDATNPSPAQGWNQQERSGFDQRARGDAVIALAFIHRLAISNNIPLGAAVDWIISVAPVGIIEFPPKSDPMVHGCCRAERTSSQTTARSISSPRSAAAHKSWRASGSRRAAGLWSGTTEAAPAPDQAAALDRRLRSLAVLS